MKKITILFALLIFGLNCFNIVQAEEVENKQVNQKEETIKTKKEGNFKKKIKEFFKSLNTKMEEINASSMIESNLYLNNKKLTYKYNNSIKAYYSTDLKNFIMDFEQETNNLRDVYIKNPTNMKNNSQLVSQIRTGISILELVNKDIEENIIETAYKNYLEIVSLKIRENLYESFDYEREYNSYYNYDSYAYDIKKAIYTKEQFLEKIKEDNWIKILDNNKNLLPYWKQLAEEVNKYSYNYEKENQTLSDFVKFKKFIAKNKSHNYGS